MWCEKFVSYTLGYHRIYGDTADSYNKVWALYIDLVKTDHLGFYAAISFIDSGYNTSVIYEICERLAIMSGLNSIRAFATKGYNTGKIWSASDDDLKSSPLIKINVDLTKQDVYKRLGLSIVNDVVPNTYCYFPNDFEIEYFKMLTSEERHKTFFNGKENYKWHK